MKIREIRDLPLPGLRVVRFDRFADERGYFTETFRAEQIGDALGGPFRIEQANESFSRGGVVRGLHFQWSPWQGKLVRPLSGRLLDIALDIRRGAPTYGCAVVYAIAADRDAAADEWIWLPPGFAHGIALAEETLIEYLCTGPWSPGNEASISPFADDLDWSLCDPRLKAELDAIVAAGAVVTEKDRDGHSLAAWEATPDAARFVYDPAAPFAVRSERSD